MTPAATISQKKLSTAKCKFTERTLMKLTKNSCNRKLPARAISTIVRIPFLYRVRA